MTKIKLDICKKDHLTIEQVSQIVYFLENFEHEITYTYANQDANAKSLINLLALDICDKPLGLFTFDKNEAPSNIEEFKKLLESFN